MNSKLLPTSSYKSPWVAYLSTANLLWALFLLVATLYAATYYQHAMDIYETAILVMAAIVFTWLGISWKAIQGLILSIAIFSLLSISLYNGELLSAERNFFLKFLLSSQSSIMWMNVLFVMAMFAYIAYLLSDSRFVGQVATSFTWIATMMGLNGMLVRWYESYLLGADIGHIPVSNLYEVFVLFCVTTALIYLYYENKVKNRAMGAFVLLIINVAIGFIIWYTYSKGADEIQPLVPALQSYWMKIHVPANFIGYACFSLSAMLGAAFLVRTYAEQRFMGAKIIARMPSFTLLNEVMYKSIALGFAFFTMATILGALWAAEAWGGYWSWDPKETWALIVWLNYAAWLHTRMTKGKQGTFMAWWSVIGLFITMFAFLGVNIFLSGLHSYGEL